jgi:G3E family GTPase
MGFSGVNDHFPCKVILIGGFLGAGKTTLLRHILQWHGDLSRTALLVNEFGRVGIDGELLQGFQNPMVELTNGCICCSLQSDMIKAVEEILNGFQPERLLIEATGVADPYDILKFLGSSSQAPRLSLQTVVTVLDADLWEGREYFGPLFYNQITAADLLLFNKIDLLPKEDIPKFLEEVREINKSCSIIPTFHCQIEPEILWAPLGSRTQAPVFQLPGSFTEHGSAEAIGFVAFSFEAWLPFKDECFRRFVHELPLNLYRLKGFVLLDGKRFLLNHVGGKTEWTEVDQTGTTKLAFVGWEVNEGEVIEQLKCCLRYSS